MNNIFYLFYYFLIYEKSINTYIRPPTKINRRQRPLKTFKDL